MDATRLTWIPWNDSTVLQHQRAHSPSSIKIDYFSTLASIKRETRNLLELQHEVRDIFLSLQLAIVASSLRSLLSMMVIENPKHSSLNYDKQAPVTH